MTDHTEPTPLAFTLAYLIAEIRGFRGDMTEAFRNARVTSWNASKLKITDWLKGTLHQAFRNPARVTHGNASKLENSD